MVTLELNKLVPLILVLGLITLSAPNSQEIMRNHWLSTNAKPEEFSGIADKIAWRPAFGWSLACTIVFVVSLANIGMESSFLYYEF